MIRPRYLPASIDIGSHSSLLLIADWASTEDGKRLEAKIQQMEVVRLGEDLAQGIISSERIADLKKVLLQFRQIVHALGAELKSVVMTEAVRKANNQLDIIQMVRDILWIEPQILSGDEEAFLAWAAVAHWHGKDQVTLDVGGGSSELSQGTEVISMPVGALRLKQQFGEMPGPEYKKWAKETLSQFELKAFSKKPLTLVGGTATALAMLRLDLVRFDAQAIEGLTLDLQEIDHQISRVVNISKELRSKLPGLEKGRHEVIICGLYWIRSLVEKLKPPSVRISTLGLRFGVLLEDEIIQALKPEAPKKRGGFRSK